MKAQLPPDPGKHSSVQNRAAHNTGNVLVLDSSESALNAQEYALQLASAHDWNVTLLRVIDLDQFPESGNAVSLSRLLSEQHRHFARKMESYKEIIEPRKVKVDVGEPIVVSQFQLDTLQQNIARVEPDLMIVGRSSFSKSFLKTMVTQAKFPVLIIPENQLMQRPNSLLLCSDGHKLPERMLLPVLDFAAQTRQHVSILSVMKRRKFKVRKFQSHLPTSTSSTLVDFYQQEGSDTVLAIEKFLGKKSFDMLSIIVQDHWWLRRLFYRWSFVDLAHRIDVPLLVVKLK